MKVSYNPMIRIFAIDNHFLRSIQFCDSMERGDGFDGRLFVNWKVHDRVFFHLNCECRYLKASGYSKKNAIGVVLQNTVDLEKQCTVVTESYDLIFKLGLILRFK